MGVASRDSVERRTARFIMFYVGATSMIINPCQGSSAGQRWRRPARPGTGHAARRKMTCGNVSVSSTFSIATSHPSYATTYLSLLFSTVYSLPVRGAMLNNDLRPRGARICALALLHAGPRVRRWNECMGKQLRSQLTPGQPPIPVRDVHVNTRPTKSCKIYYLSRKIFHGNLSLSVVTRPEWEKIWRSS